MAAEGTSTLAAIRTWVAEHKLRTVGTLWASGLAGSFAYNWAQPNMKTSVKIIHASPRIRILCGEQCECPIVADDRKTPQSLTDLGLRLHAQALTLAALSGAALVNYFEHRSGEKAKQYEKEFLVEAKHD